MHTSTLSPPAARPEQHLDPETREKFLAIKTGSGTFRMNVALAELESARLDGEAALGSRALHAHRRRPRAGRDQPDRGRPRGGRRARGPSRGRLPRPAGADHVDRPRLLRPRHLGRGWREAGGAADLRAAPRTFGGSAGDPHLRLSGGRPRRERRAVQRGAVRARRAREASGRRLSRSAQAARPYWS